MVKGVRVACAAGPIHEVPDDSQAPLYAAPAAHQRVCRNAVCGMTRHAKSHTLSARKSSRRMVLADTRRAGRQVESLEGRCVSGVVALSLCRVHFCFP